MSDTPKFCAQCGGRLGGGRFCGACGWDSTTAATAPMPATTVTDTPVAQAPVADTPAADAPVTDTPVPDAPGADDPVADVTEPPVTRTHPTVSPVSPFEPGYEPGDETRHDEPVAGLYAGPLPTSERDRPFTDDGAPTPGTWFEDVAHAQESSGATAARPLVTADDPAVPVRTANDRKPLLIGAAAALALVGLVGGGYLATRSHDDPPPASSPTSSPAPSSSGSVADDAAASATSTTGSATGSSSPASATASASPTADDAEVAARAAATSVSRLLTRSAGQRKLLAAATSCSTSVGTSRGYLERVVRGREDLLSELSTLDVEAIPNGEALRRALTDAWNHSLKADRNFAQWAEGRSPSWPCETTGSYSWDQGVQESQQGQVSKAEFVSLWNPVAKKYKLPTVDRSKF